MLDGRPRIGRLPVVLLFCGVVAGCGSDPVPGESPGERGRSDSPAPTLLEGARLIVGDGSVMEEGALLISGERIEAVGAAGTVNLPEGGARVDVSGRTIIPALIDGHAHLGYEGYTGWGAEHYSLENLTDHLQRYAYYGFGAVFSAGTDPDSLALALQRAQRTGELGGARFLFGAGLAPPGQGPNDRFLEHTSALTEETGRPVVRGAATAEQGRRAVREIAASGIAVIKIWVDDRGGSQEKLSPTVYGAIMDEAHARGLEVFVHQQSAAEMSDLVRAGADGFLHGRLGPELDARIAALLAEEDVFLVPNLGLGELRREDITEDPFLRETLHVRVRDRLREARESSAVSDASDRRRERELGEAMRRLLDAGVPVVLGTDAGAIPDHFFGYTGHRELEILVRLGMPPMQALVSATGRAARQLGLEDSGTLQPGNRADFVVLEANPLRDIRNTRRIENVMLRGRPVDRDSLRESWTAEVP